MAIISVIIFYTEILGVMGFVKIKSPWLIIQAPNYNLFKVFDNIVACTSMRTFEVHSNTSLKLLLSNVNECVSTRESKEHVEGLNSKVKLQLYKSFGKEVDFKTYLHGDGVTCVQTSPYHLLRGSS